MTNEERKVEDKKRFDMAKLLGADALGYITNYYLFVVRTHSCTDRNHLIKVMSRRVKNVWTAWDWKEFCEEQEKNPKHKFGIIVMASDQEVI